MRLVYVLVFSFSLVFFSFSIITKGNSKSVNLVDSKYDYEWFNKLAIVWDSKYLAEVNKVNPVDILLIRLAFGDIDLYLTKLSNLLTHINCAFNNNELFHKFNSTDSLAYNFFNFISYVKTLKYKNVEELDKLLNQEFNMYEVVSIKRLTEVDLAQRVNNAKNIIIKESLNNNKIEEISNEYDLLYVQEMYYEKKKLNKTSYIACLNKLDSITSLQDKILDCNKLYAEDKKENYLIGIRSCYLFQLNNLKNDNNININNVTTINSITKELHANCYKLVDNYLQKFPESSDFIKKHVNFLINFFISYKIFNI